MTELRWLTMGLLLLSWGVAGCSEESGEDAGAVDATPVGAATLKVALSRDIGAVGIELHPAF